MTTQVYLCPTFGVGYQGFTTGGLPLNAGLLYTYIAGGTTPQATYTDSIGSTLNANPIVLDADGRTPSEVWLLAGQAYRFDLKDSLGNLIKSYDNVTGINDPAVASPTGVLTTVAGTNTITAVASPVPTAYAKGQRWLLTPANSITAAATLNISGVGARNIMKRSSGGIVATVANDLIAANTYLLEDDGTQLIIEGVRPYSQGADVTSATTINLNTATGDYVHVTGTTTITAITLAQGEERTVEFTGALTLTNGASLILPGGASITTAAGDTAIFRGEAAGVVRCITYVKATSGVLPAGFGMSPLTNSLGADVTFGDTNFHDGPSVAQGTTGTWLAIANITLTDSTGSANFVGKLYDGTTTKDSRAVRSSAANGAAVISLCGVFTNPAGNIRAAAKDTSSASGSMLFNSSGLSLDSTIVVIRIG
ncbi:MAG TPA: hypothetical protein VF516_03185 [Kofleriaceae bacterium]